MVLQKMLLSLGLIFLGLMFGQSIKVKLGGAADKAVSRSQRFVLLVLSPVVNLSAFWVVRVTDTRFMALPVLCALALGLGGAIAVMFSRLLGHDRKKAGAMFSSGALTNIGTIGGLVCYAFLGEPGYALASMYRVFEDFICFGALYPIAKTFSDTKADDEDQTGIVRRVLSDPFIRVYMTSMIAGTALNLSGVPRPAFFGGFNEVMIPLTSLILVTTVGYRMHFGAVRNYLRECLAVGLIKFLAVPVVVVSVGYLLGLGRIYDGTALKVVLILSSMPPAFLSLIPPQIYDLDTDLANSSWLVNTGALVLVLPVLFIIQNRM
jgi:predicted permease